MNPRHFRKYLSLLLFLISFSVLSQEKLPGDSIDIYDMSLEQLMNLKTHGVPSELEEVINQLIAAASKKPLSTRESPNIVSLITREEILNSGARDLIDVLRLVPGIQFALDVEGVVGIGMRGNWGHEGKVLVLLDGLEMNEIMFATTQFGNHFPVDQIQKVEVVRGPGSAVFGGFAEYGVINIVTRNSRDLEGISASATYGQMERDYGRRNLSLSMGHKWGNWNFGGSVFAGQGNRSDREYTDLYGNTYYMNGNSNLHPFNANLFAGNNKLSFRFMADLYQISVRDGYDVAKEIPYREDFNSLFGEVKYAMHLSATLDLTIKASYKHQTPWKTLDVDTITTDYYKSAERALGQFLFSWNPTRKINFTYGLEIFSDKAKDHVDSSFFANEKQTVSYLNQAYFLQGLIKTRLVNFIAGARVDIHSEFGSAFVPRLGLTKKIEKFNFKLLYSNSFRAPSIENINLAPQGIKPEYTTVLEFETGYQLSRNSIFTLNFFDITTRDPIVYYYDDSLATDNYKNSDLSMGTLGIEAELRIKNKWGYLSANYSYYSAAGKDRVEDYEVPDITQSLVAFSNHRASMNACIKLGRNININPTLHFFGKGYGYASLDTPGNSVISEFAPLMLVNFFINYEASDKFPLRISLGVHDLASSGIKFIQPYNGYHAPLPGPSREIVLKLNYEFKPKKKDKTP
jgi:outer membrane cobalamin receptor